MAAPVPGQDPTAGSVTSGNDSSYRPTIQSPEAHQLHESPSSGASSSSTSSTSAQQQQEAQPQAQPRSSRAPQAHRRPSSPNASSAPITQASGAYTGGVVNRHPNAEAVGSSDSKDGQNVQSGGAAPAPASAAGAGAEDGGTTEDIIAFRVGVSEDRNTKCRRSMEDSHAFVYDFGGVKVS